MPRRRLAVALLALLAGGAAARAEKVPLIGRGVALPRRAPPVKQDAVLRCTCGPASLESSLRYWVPSRGLWVPNELGVASAAALASYAIQPRLAHPAFLWNDPRGLLAVAQMHGLHGKIEPVVRTDLLRNQLAEWVALGETVIVHRLLDGRSPSEGHFTVVDGVDGVGVHMMDPWPDRPQYEHTPWGIFHQQHYNPLTPWGNAIRISALPTPLTNP